MPNNFKIEIKDGATWKQVSAVFPFSVGELLDERLDEAYVTFFSTVKAYKPLTEFRITFYRNQDIEELNPDSNGESIEYFILANDNSSEYPAGSGTYKHFCYLLERTKLLDGVLAPSLTFTNEQPRDYDILDYNTINGDELLFDKGIGNNPYTIDLEGLFVERLPSVITKGKEYIFPSSRLVGASFVRWLESQTDITPTLLESFVPTGQNYSVYTRIKYLDEYSYWNNDIKIISNSDFTITYEICASTTTNIDIGRFYLPFHVKVADAYPATKPYTITDCVNRVLELAEPLRGTDNPRFTFDGVEYENGVATASSSYPVGSQAAKYEKIRAPEFTMTQSTLREQLKVIGSYIHAEPWLDENNVVHFLDYGSTKQSGQVSENTPYVAESAKTDINQYCTEIRSNAQNLVSSLGFAKGVIIEPAGGAYRSLRTETMYVRIDETNGIAATDLPIYSVQSVICGVASGDDDISGWLYEPKDITPYVFEATEYGANLSSFGGGYPYSKSWGIYYTQGQKGIRGLFYQDPDALDTASYSPWAIANILSAVHAVSPKEVYNNIDDKARNLVFQITYKPIAPAFLSHGKQYYISGEVPYTQIYNQGDNLVETQYYGENMKGVVARLGNIEQERTYMLSSREIIPRVGDMIGEYAISAVSVEYMPFYIKCTVGLSKDFNRISQYVGINSVKRMYEISERQAQKRDILIKETLLISDSIKTNDENVMFYIHGFMTAFKGNSADSTVKAALFAGDKKNNEDIKSILLPCIGRSFGNTIHFAFTMKDNYSAGDISEWTANDNASGRWQGDAPYTDYYGRIYWANVVLVSRFYEPNEATMAFTLPKSEGYESTSSFAAMFSSKHRLRKDNREIIGYNIEVEYKTDQEDVIIGSALAARCGYINSVSTSCEIWFTKRAINKFEKSFIPDESIDVKAAFSVDENALTIRTRETVGNWVIITPVEKTTVSYVNEDGETFETEETTGGDILLFGSRDAGFEFDDNNDYLRTLYFTMKRS